MLAIPFPHIDPVLIELGPLVIRWYALAYLGGIMIGWWLVNRLMARASLWPADTAPTDKQGVDDYVLWATLGIVLGGRLGYILFYNFDHFMADPSRILRVWEGGMAFHGGLAGVIIATILFCRRRNIPLLNFADALAMVAPLGLMFGRLANFINGELWGRTADLPWAMVFPGAGPLARHPSQLYEAGLEGLLLFVLLYGMGRFGGALKRPGTLVGLFFIGYGCARTFVEFFREPDPQLGFLMNFGSGGLTMGMMLSLPLVLIGIGFLIYGKQRQAPAHD